MIDHVTYHVPVGTLADPDLESFMRSIGLREIPADDVFEHGWKVRWFRGYKVDVFGSRSVPPNLHLVEHGDMPDVLSLGHFCVVIPNVQKELLARTAWCVRNSGSGRIWLEFANLRVEVRGS